MWLAEPIKKGESTSDRKPAVLNSNMTSPSPNLCARVCVCVCVCVCVDGAQSHSGTTVDSCLYLILIPQTIYGNETEEREREREKGREKARFKIGSNRDQRKEPTRKKKTETCERLKNVP